MASITKLMTASSRSSTPRSTTSRRSRSAPPRSASRRSTSSRRARDAARPDPGRADPERERRRERDRGVRRSRLGRPVRRDDEHAAPASSGSTTRTSRTPTASTRPATTRARRRDEARAGGDEQAVHPRDRPPRRRDRSRPAAAQLERPSRGSPSVIGVKTGHTDGAGWSEVAAARGGGVTIYATLLGGQTREGRNADLSGCSSGGCPATGRSGRSTATASTGQARTAYGKDPVAPRGGEAGPAGDPRRAAAASSASSFPSRSRSPSARGSGSARSEVLCPRGGDRPLAAGRRRTRSSGRVPSDA